ncbi:MAG: response regulator transcription factor [Saprospiraceae bacterium]|nr:response regulator transcription factor [Saprospiraceae bacterium]
MIKAIIVEDTLDNRETLKKLLVSECPQVQLLGEAENVEGGYQLVKSMQPDLVFLDIQLDKETSFDLLERLHAEDAIRFEIVFVTGHGSFENVTRAIEFSALDFINKPIEAEKLTKAVEKAAKRLDQKQYNRQIELLLEHLQQSEKSQRIAFHLLRGVVEFAWVTDIVRLEADGVITHVHLRDGSKLTAVKNLGHYSRLLTAEHHFFQISNSMVVNLDCVKQYNHASLTLTLNNGLQVKAARRGGQAFRQYLSDNKAYSNLERSNNHIIGLIKSLLGR